MGKHYSAILYFGLPRDVLSVLPSQNLPCQVYARALETFNWQNVSISVNPDENKTLYSWSVRRVFVWRRNFLLYTICDCVLLPCVSLLKSIAKCLQINMVRSKGHRIHLIRVFTGKMMHASAQNIKINAHVFVYVNVLACVGQVYLYI